ncbi:MAG: hypothetical protein K2N51_16680 [Lachnospiraceae bacterium]|nr:hypothetical protein [Lachnospiraceae bacterium]
MKNIEFYEAKKYEDGSKYEKAVKQLTEIVGKHVYEKEYPDEEDGETYLTVVIE